LRLGGDTTLASNGGEDDRHDVRAEDDVAFAQKSEMRKTYSASNVFSTIQYLCVCHNTVEHARVDTNRNEEIKGRLRCFHFRNVIS